MRGLGIGGGNSGHSAVGGLNFNGGGNQLSRSVGRNGPSGLQAFSNSVGSRGDRSRGSIGKNWGDGEKFAHSHDNHFSDFHRGNFDHGDHFHDFHHHGNFVIAPFWWPLWWPAWWGGGYANDYYGYGSPYCYYYDENGYAPTNVDYAPIDNSVAATESPQSRAQSADENYSAEESGGSSSAGAAFFSRTEDAFQAGKYRDAVRMANHAAVESPRNPKAAELMSLALFADGDYRSAAAQAHAALALGPVTTWNTLRGYYGNDVESYTTQLRAWKSIATTSPTAPEGHFLLAYQYLMTGYTKQAVKQLTEVVKLAPGDKLSAELLQTIRRRSPGIGTTPAADA